MTDYDDGLVATAYAPCRVETVMDGSEIVTIMQETEYPFDGTIRFIIKADHPVRFPLRLRVPA